MLATKLNNYNKERHREKNYKYRKATKICTNWSQVQYAVWHV